MNRYAYQQIRGLRVLRLDRAEKVGAVLDLAARLVDNERFHPFTRVRVARFLSVPHSTARRVLDDMCRLDEDQWPWLDRFVGYGRGYVYCLTERSSSWVDNSDYRQIFAELAAMHRERQYHKLSEFMSQAYKIGDYNG